MSFRLLLMVFDQSNPTLLEPCLTNHLFPLRLQRQLYTQWTMANEKSKFHVTFSWNSAYNCQWNSLGKLDLSMWIRLKVPKQNFVSQYPNLTTSWLQSCKWWIILSTKVLVKGSQEGKVDGFPWGVERRESHMHLSDLTLNVTHFSVGILKSDQLV